MSVLLRTLLDIILPRHCPVCGSLVESGEDCICPPCLASAFSKHSPRKTSWKPFACSQQSLRHVPALQSLSGPKPPPDGQQWHFNREAVVFVGHYRGALRVLITSFKFHRRRDVGEVLAQRLSCMLKDRRGKGPEVVIPIPLAPLRLRDRGYNQSEDLARSVASGLAVPLDTGSLVRIKETEPQAKLDGERRYGNVRNAFRVQSAAAVRGRRVLLVDDLLTTGATMKNCTEALLQAGAEEIFGAVVAYTPLNKKVRRRRSGKTD